MSAELFYDTIPQYVREIANQGVAKRFQMVSYTKLSTPGTVYINVVADKPVLDAVDGAHGSEIGFGVFLTISKSLATGEYNGNFKVSACSDPKCEKHLAGSPFLVPYQIIVIPERGTIVQGNLSPLKKIQNGREWTGVQGISTRNAYIPITLDPKAFNLRWKWYSGATFNWYLSRPQLVSQRDTVVFVPVNSSSLIALNEFDASKKWNSAQLPAAIYGGGPMVLKGNKLYTSTESLNAFDSTNGNKIFSTAAAFNTAFTRLPPEVSDTTIYTVINDKKLKSTSIKSFDSTSGIEKQTATFADIRHILLNNGSLYAVSATELRIYDASNLDSFSSVPLPNDGGKLDEIDDLILANPTTLVFGAGSTERKQYRLNFDTSEKKFRWMKLSTRGTAAVADGLIYANSGSLEVWANKESDGSLSWLWYAPSWIGTDNADMISNVIVTNNLVFISTDANVYAFDRQTKKTVWTYPVSGQLSISDNGILYVCNDEGVIAFNLQ